MGKIKTKEEKEKAKKKGEEVKADIQFRLNLVDKYILDNT
jgi:hypothetical protein